MNRPWPILVVDDEHVMRISMAAWLREDGYAVDTAASGREAVEKAREKDYAIYFIDLKMPPGMDGIEAMIEVMKFRPEASIVIITAYATVDTAIAAMKEGAQEYLVKPCNPQEISLLTQRILKVKQLERENLLLREKLYKQYNFQNIISKNPRMKEIFALVQDVASLRSTVLIQGESGTGKEMIARAVHTCGDRADRPFVAVSCAALTETLLESELFGHERGAFTGAVSARKGKIELADSGTLFLDEIGDVSPKLQMDLLRVLQERRFFRVGGTEEVQVDVRVIAATKRDLQEAVREGEFRDDLYYRLNVINIHIPPLRERREDIPLLVRHFIERLSVELGRDVQDVTDGAIRVLVNHDWPGNVRELQNAVERSIITCKNRALDEGDFGFMTQSAQATQDWVPPTHLPLQEVERRVIEATLRGLGGNVRATAEALGIDRSTLYERVKKYGISR
ncbi:MAG: Fis family transcriptional regulator [Candidatus Handelsmanbacteria bacterium RIFCSPLOWO2_12_FULL_64_10]|uniref:Fis family transcriptional regulator n=1 Tax=Handelsmanbacteria sp. (strain RIFCSPLOWO2_12_FULL_64_10) TaxID=1817868 RepID=A0A1F6C4M9_HANXR|nr:MAG: Fis family transcriptional regulator [Candidatus Handelsmanbacteria bacterium RIFCSPLOWO2_12_FULL_64_10]